MPLDAAAAVVAIEKLAKPLGLSNVEADRQRNIQLLKERAWLDIPIVYTNQRKGLIAVEKGTPGERAFGEVFAAWGQ